MGMAGIWPVCPPRPQMQGSTMADQKDQHRRSRPDPVTVALVNGTTDAAQRWDMPVRRLPCSVGVIERRSAPAEPVCMTEPPQIVFPAARFSCDLSGSIAYSGTSPRADHSRNRQEPTTTRPPDRCRPGKAPAAESEKARWRGRRAIKRCMRARLLAAGREQG